MTVRDTDRGYARLLARLRRSERQALHLVVGITERHSEVLDAALAAEFGTSTEPERSFLRAWFDTHRTENTARLRAAALRIVSGEPEAAVLEEIGAAMVDEIRGAMQAGIAPALAPSTAAAKGTTVPLVGGALEESLEAEVRR